MSKVYENWFSIGETDAVTLVCADCNNKVDLEFGFLDHHPAICPICKIERAYLDCRDRKVQIIPTNAPPEFQLFLKWMQKDLDEFEYVELLVCFEEILDKLAELNHNKLN